MEDNGTGNVKWEIQAHKATGCIKHRHDGSFMLSLTKRSKSEFWPNHVSKQDAISGTKFNEQLKNQTNNSLALHFRSLMSIKGPKSLISNFQIFTVTTG